MNEEFYCSLKLISGEEIFSLISIDDNDGDPIIILQNPVTMKILDSNIGTAIKISPWMKIPKDDFYIIKFDKVITMTEVKEIAVINIYRKYLNDSINIETEDIYGKVTISNSMGYISSVEDARKKLEMVFKSL